MEIQTESENYIVIHFHDWTDKTHDSRYKMISNNQDPFTSENDYSYIECIDKKTGKIIFKKPCPALTKILISPDEKYIVGISNIKLWNPYQLVIFETSGKLIKKRHIPREEAKLDTKQFEDFKKKFPQQFQVMDSLGIIHKYKKNYNIDFFQMGIHENNDEAWDYLIDYLTTNYLSKCFGGSVTNWVNWYFEDSPEIEFVYRDSKLFSISLLDLCEKRFEIRINE